MLLTLYGLASRLSDDVGERRAMSLLAALGSGLGWLVGVVNCEWRIANGERLDFQQNLDSGVEGEVGERHQHLVWGYPADSRHNPGTTRSIGQAIELHNLRLAIRYSPILALQDAPNRVTIHAVLDTPGYLVLADTWYPGWQATVDGEPAEVLQANYAFQAVYLEAGEHTVKMDYQPTSVLVGDAVSLTTLTLLVVELPLTRRRGVRA